MKMIIETTGHSQGNLECNSFNSWCGSIKHGLGLSFEKGYGWVVSFEDFEKVYLAAKAYRDLKGANIFEDEEEE
jgi:hypothetical protein